MDTSNIEIVVREMLMFKNENSSSKVAEFLVATDVD
jgi:hypothetical protein